VRGAGLEFPQIRPRREGSIVAGENDGAHLRIGVELRDQFGQQRPHAHAQRVQDVRPVDAQQRDAVGRPFLEDFRHHTASPASRSRARAMITCWICDVPS